MVKWTVSKTSKTLNFFTRSLYRSWNIKLSPISGTIDFNGVKTRVNFPNPGKLIRVQGASSHVHDLIFTIVTREPVKNYKMEDYNVILSFRIREISDNRKKAGLLILQNVTMGIYFYDVQENCFIYASLDFLEGKVKRRGGNINPSETQFFIVVK